LLTPSIFCEKVTEKFNQKKISNLSLKILSLKEIQELKMNLLLSVNAGNYEKEPAYVVVLEYLGDSSSTKKLGIVGKGITFDSGGYCLKPSSAMQDMKFDMSGAAISCASIFAIAELQLKINVAVVACITENKIGSQANLIDSVITAMDGTTVEINNTDAEGRLVLADGITYALNELQADKIITVATLTGAILIALGSEITGTFSNNDELFNQFNCASKETYEDVARLPLHSSHYESIKSSEVAQLSNIGKNSYGGSCTAAAFLEIFAKKKPFLHLDIAGTAYEKHRGKGVMVKTIVKFTEFLSNH
jgi:leucyl aminopeptidase